MIRKLSDTWFRSLILVIAISFSGSGFYNFFHNINLPTDENIFTDPPSKIIVLNKMVGYKELVDANPSDTITAGSIIISVEGLPIQDTNDINRIADKFGDGLLKVEIFDRNRLFRRFTYLFATDLTNSSYRELKSAVLVIYIKPEGASDAAGIKPGDLILAIDGQQFSSAIEADRILTKSSTKSSLDYLVLHRTDEAHRKVRLVTFGINFFTLFRILVSLIYIGFSLFFAFGKSKFYPARLLALALLFFAVVLISSNIRYYPSSSVLSITWHITFSIAFSFAFAFLLHFLLYYPVEQTHLLRRKWIYRTPYILAIIITVILNYDYFIEPSGWINYIANLVFVPFLVFRIGTYLALKKEYLKDVQRIARPVRNLFYFMLVVFIVNLAAIRIKPIASMLSDHFFTLFLAILGIFPFVLFYTLARYRFYDITLRIRRNIIYALSKGFFDMLFFVSLILLFYVVGNLTFRFPNIHFTGDSIEFLSRPLPAEKNLQFEKVAISVLSVLSIFALFWLKRRTSKFLLKKFHRSKFDYRQAATDLSELIIRNITLSDLARNILKELQKLQFIKSAGLVIFQNETRICCQEFYGIDPIIISEFTASTAHKLIEFLKNVEQEVAVELLPQPLNIYLKESKFEFVLPIRYKEKLEGCIFVGEKLSESKMGTEDFEFLSIIAGNIAIAIDNAFLYEELAQRERIKRELEIAQRIQLASLPKEMPKIEAFDISAISLPAYEVGGDFFDFFHRDSELTVVVGDVSGKGTSAALYMAKIQGIMKTLSEFDLPLKELFSKANTLLTRSLEKNFFISCIGARFYFDEQRVTIVRAGHLGLYYFNASSNKIEKITPDGIVLGIAKSEKFVENTQELDLRYNLGDCFVFISDGVIEQTTDNQVMFKEDKLVSVLEKCSHETAESIKNRILSEVCNFDPNAQLFDDMTILVVKPLQNGNEG